MGDLGEVGGEILKAPDEIRDGLAAIEEADMLGAEVRVGPLVRDLADDRRELGKIRRAPPREPAGDRVIPGAWRASAGNTTPIGPIGCGRKRT